MQVRTSPASPRYAQARLSNSIKGGYYRAALLALLVWSLSLFCPGDKLHAADVLRMGVAAAGPVTFDPHRASGTDTIVADMVFNALLRYQPGNSAVIEPDLAESVPKPKMEGGKQVWTFTLKKGVMFHPGPKNKAYELTSEDVLYSLQKAADPARSAYAESYAGMSFKRLGPYGIQVILDKTLSATLMLPRFANREGGFIVCRKAVEAMGDEGFNAWPIGTGPFAFKGYATERGVELATHRAYFRGTPRLDGVEVIFQPDIAAREQGFTSSELTVICGLRSAAWVQKAALWDKTVVDVFGPGETLGLAFDVDRSPFSDKRVRMACAYALNRQTFADIFGPGLAQKLYAPVPPERAGGVAVRELKPLGLDYETDLAKARQLLREAGLENGFTLEIIRPEHCGDQYLYEVLQSQLNRIGINIVLTAGDASGACQSMGPGMSPVVFRWLGQPTADDILMQALSTNKTALSTGASKTSAGYSKLDILLEAARRETGLKKQHEIWKHAQIKLLQDMAYYPISTIRYAYTRRAEVDYGYTLQSTMAIYPQITEKTHFLK